MSTTQLPLPLPLVSSVAPLLLIIIPLFFTSYLFYQKYIMQSYQLLCYLMPQLPITGQFRVFHSATCQYGERINICQRKIFDTKPDTCGITYDPNNVLQITLTFSVVYHHRLWLKQRLAQSLKPQQKCWQLTQSCSFFSSFYHHHQWKERSNWDQRQPCVYQSLGCLSS